MIKRKDLVDIGDTDYHQRQGEFMECQDCGHEIGGTRGDYWQLDMDQIFTCPDCNSENIAIVRRVCTTKIIRQ